jgi:hypothetical protein
VTRDADRASLTCSASQTAIRILRSRFFGGFWLAVDVSRRVRVTQAKDRKDTAR